MQISIGYDIGYGADVPTPMVIMLNVHPSRLGDLVGTEQIATEPAAPITYYRDGFGNICGRLVVPRNPVPAADSLPPPTREQYRPPRRQDEGDAPDTEAGRIPGGG